MDRPVGGYAERGKAKETIHKKIEWITPRITMKMRVDTKKIYAVGTSILKLINNVKLEASTKFNE